MFKVIAGLIALTGVALATPAVAQSVYLGNSGVSVGIGERGYDRGYRGYDERPRYRSYGHGGNFVCLRTPVRDCPDRPQQRPRENHSPLPLINNDVSISM